MSLGQVPPAEDGRARDPEELVEEDQELVRWGAASAREAANGQGSAGALLLSPMWEAACCLTFHLLAPLTISGSWQSE